MQNSQSEDSYKLAGAAQIAARLMAPERPAPKPDTDSPAVQGYIRFKGPQPPSAAAAPVPEPTHEALTWHQDMAGPAGWNVLLARVQTAVDAQGAFVVDPQGLVIASAGTTPGDGPEAVGSRLAFAFEQADRMAEPGVHSQTLTIELGPTWLSGLRITIVGEVRLVVGVCAPTPLPATTLKALARVFTRKAMGA